MAKKIKSNSSLLDELDKPLYEGRWKDIEQILKKTKKKHVVPEAFSHFLLGVELAEVHFLGPQGRLQQAQSTAAAAVHPDKVLSEAEAKLKQCVDQCQPGHDASLEQLAKIKVGQLKWLRGDYKSSLVALTEVQNTADISLLFTCKILLEGNLYMGLCFEQLVSSTHNNNNNGPATDKFQAIHAYEESLRHAIALVHLARELSTQQHPATFKAIKTVLERGTILALQMQAPLRALNMLRRVMQSRDEDVLKECRMVCSTCLSSLLLFHFSSMGTYAPPSVSSHSVAFSPGHLQEELNLVSLLSKATTDAWNPSRESPPPSPAVTFDLLVLALSDAKLPAHMVQVLESAMRFSCDLPHIWLQFALALVSNNQNEQALAVFKECVSLSPNDPLVLCTAAKFSLDKANQPDLCLRWAHMAVGHVVAGHFLRPRVEFLLGRGFTALAEKERSSQKRGDLHKQGLHHLTTAASLDSRSVEYAFHHALRKAEARDLVSAGAEVKRALSLNAGHTSCLHLLALILSAQRHYSEALGVCGFALQRQPENFGLLECKAKLEVISVNTHEALKTCKYALRLWQKLFSGETTGLIGLATQDLQSLSEIPLTAYERSDRNESFSIDLASDTGSSHFSLGASQMPVSQPNLLQARIWCTIAEVFLSAGKVPDAYSCVREAQYLGPYLSSVLTTHGRVLELEKKAGQAMKLYNNALSLQPGNPVALTLVGRLLHQSGKNVEAEKYLREATQVDQLSHEAWYWLGEVFTAQKHFELGSECFKTSLDLEASTSVQPFSAVLSSFILSS